MGSHLKYLRLHEILYSMTCFDLSFCLQGNNSNPKPLYSSKYCVKLNILRPKKELAFEANSLVLHIFDSNKKNFCQKIREDFVLLAIN